MQPVPTIAVLSGSAALASILGATLSRNPRWRVRQFRDRQTLYAYMRLAPVGVLVTDYTLENDNAADIACAIRGDAELVSRDVRIIALSRAVGPDMRRRCIQAGIDEVIAKPMSPLYLQERVGARLGDGATGYVRALPHYLGPERRDRIVMPDRRRIPVERRGDNIVSFMAHKAMRVSEEAFQTPPE